MRTIRFRGKRLLDNKFVYGSLVQCLDGSVGIFCGDDFEHHKIFAIKTSTIGQLTGFHDRNGKEIYEGDIIDVHIPCNSIGKEEHRTRVVVWNEKYARFEFQDKRGNCIADSVGAKYNVVYYEVVGNVFDNPELLEEGGDK